MHGMAIRTPNVISPVFAATEIVMRFFSSMTRETGFGDGLRALVYKRDDGPFNGRIFDVLAARPMA
jgi:hypothetical protein